MPIRKRPSETGRSEHWLRVAVNEKQIHLDLRVSKLFGFEAGDRITWLSPLKSDGYAEYFDQEFLDRLGLHSLKVPLSEFWPRSGPRWDGLAKTASGKYILVEAKAYIEEGVDYRSKASPDSLEKIRRALSDAKKAFRAADAAPWESPFYQYANRLAHLYFLRQLNGVHAYLLFICFADAPDVPYRCSKQQWEGAIRLTEKCLGLGTHPFGDYVHTLIWSVPEMLAGARKQVCDGNL